MNIDITSLGGWLHDPDEVERTLAGMPRPYFRSAAPDLSRSGAGRPFSSTRRSRTSTADITSITCADDRRLRLARVRSWRGPARSRADLHRPQKRRIQADGDRGHLRDGPGRHRRPAWLLFRRRRRSLGGQGGQRDSGRSAVRDLVGPYDGKRAKDWGAEGVPADLQAKAPEHKVQTTSLVTTWSELEDALSNGYPVTVCSNQGFTLTRDADGFCKARGSWGHCMLIVGIRADNRPGACIFSRGGAMSPPVRSPSISLRIRSGPSSTWSKACWR